MAIHGTFDDTVGPGFLNYSSSPFTVAFGKGAGTPTGINNTMLGYQAGQALTTATDNTLVGYQAGHGITTGNATAGQNTLIGSSAGVNIVTGQGNVAVGWAALNANTGSYNTALGNQALAVSTGSFNIAIGPQSAVGLHADGGNNIAIGQATMSATSTCTGSIAMGYSALQSNTGDHNVALGFAAGAGNTSGSPNVFIGYQAGQHSSTGSNNVAIGNTMIPATTASNNVCIGLGNLNVGSDGGDNVAIGNQAGANITGNHNVCVGTLAGQGLSSGTYNVCMGYFAGAALGTVSNNVLIGNQAGGGLTTAQNVAVGASALINASSATNCVAIGYQAGLGIGTGVSNVAIGVQSLGFGSLNNPGNTAVGTSCLNNTTGSYNTGLGNLAGSGVTSGNYNVAIGFQALETSNTASDNICIGVNALQNFNGATGQNVAIGRDSGASATGANNVYIGYQAGHVTTSGSNNIVISNLGLSGDTGVTKIGTDGTQTVARIAGGLYKVRAVQPKTSTPYAVLTGTAGDSGSIMTNSGASSTQIVFNLPAAVVGLEYDFISEDSGGIQVVAAGNSAADKIRYVTTTGTATTGGAGGALTTTVQGAAFRVVCQKAGFWNVVSCMGTIGASATNIVVT